MPDWVSRIKLVFFDIGSTLVNDDEVTLKYYATLFNLLSHWGHPVTAEIFWEVRQAAIRHQLPSVSAAVVQFLCGENKELVFKELYRTLRANGHPWEELMTLQPGAREVLESLGNRFSLGVIANQRREISRRLEELEVTRFFKVWAISEVVRIAKPDPGIFRHALEKAGCKPCDALYVGDRLDNDIQPAKALGMRTVRIRAGKDQAHLEPETPEQTPDIQINALTELPQALGLPGAR
ncbi:MAG: HAD family hydrolase [Armatimonadetes bacterium]|nr:HAD family hydrolase [Armatimonadota bacterium]